MKNTPNQKSIAHVILNVESKGVVREKFFKLEFTPQHQVRQIVGSDPNSLKSCSIIDMKGTCVTLTPLTKQTHTSSEWMRVNVRILKQDNSSRSFSFDTRETFRKLISMCHLQM